MSRFGFVRVATVSPQVWIADPQRNVAAMIDVISQLGDCDLIVFPELSITGYTCADLFAQQTLLENARKGLNEIVRQLSGFGGAVVVGLPLSLEGSLYNAAAVLTQDGVAGFVPKQFLPTYNEFYEARWFRAATGDEPPTIDWFGTQVPFGIDLLFDLGCAKFGIEICEDLWVPTPPSGFLALAGAEIIVNPSASTELVAKAPWRTQLVQSQSGRCIAGYVYASSGPTESTTDVVFGGHCLIAENGGLLAQSRRVGDGDKPWIGATHAVSEIDIDRIRHDRRVSGTFATAKGRFFDAYRTVPVTIATPPWKGLKRSFSGAPFVPSNHDQLEARCAEIFGIQTAALAKRVSRLSATSPLVIGVSGGLDSTLALLVAVKACDAYGWSRDRILGLTMPGFGTSAKTRTNAETLMRCLGITSESIDIRPLCLQAFRDLEHAPLKLDIESVNSVDELQQKLMNVAADDQKDLVFENVQARIRTFLLMSRGFVLGTGDMSEQALGWSTYNGDHMSMYNVNTAVPKTLVRFLVRYAADHYFEDQTQEVLHRIADTPISPELLPLSAAGEIAQHTEVHLGPYELHDFFLYHVVRNGFTPEKILFLAEHATFTKSYSPNEIKSTLVTFYQRFFANQFKRSCVPDGPKVGTVSLSPRGDWRMPSDAEANGWLNGDAS